FSSWSMTVWNAGNGCAPTTFVPLMKKVGVPVAPTAAPSLASESTLSLNLPESSAALNLAMLRPSSSAYFSSDGRSSACWLANSLSWYGQNFPCSLAASAASAARCALSWNGSGSCLKAIFTFPLYPSSISLSTGTAREQNGHWKSLNRTTVTFALLGPLTGASPSLMFCLPSGAAGADGAADGAGASAAASMRFLYTSLSGVPPLISSS